MEFTWIMVKSWKKYSCCGWTIEGNNRGGYTVSSPKRTYKKNFYGLEKAKRFAEERIMKQWKKEHTQSM